MQLPTQSTNFAFLAEHDPLLEKLASAAESSFFRDPNTTLIKLRQLGEALAQHIASLLGIEFDQQTTQADLLFKLNREIDLDPAVRQLFHTLRIEGKRPHTNLKPSTKKQKTACWSRISWPSGFMQALARRIKTSSPAPSSPWLIQANNLANYRIVSPSLKRIS